MAEFVNAKVMSVSMKVDTTADGNIAQSGETVTSAKLATIAGIKKSASLAESNLVYDAFYGTVGGGRQDSLTAVRKIVEGVAE